MLPAMSFEPPRAAAPATAFAALLTAVVSLAATPASAALQVRPGGMVYDPATNLTWVQDLRLAAGSTFDDGLDTTDGRMSWANARAWAAALVFGGADDWRLPAVRVPAAPCGAAGGGHCGYTADAAHSEVSRLYRDGLGNLPGYLPDGSARPGVEGVDWGLINTGPFLNLRPDAVWLADEYYPGSDVAWEFWAPTGVALVYYKHFNFQAWAVRDGDIAAVPAPPAWVVMLGGLASMGLGAVARARRLRFSRLAARRAPRGP